MEEPARTASIILGVRAPKREREQVRRVTDVATLGKYAKDELMMMDMMQGIFSRFEKWRETLETSNKQ